MKEQFVTYKIALKLKELGFNKGCFGAYQLTFEEESEPFNTVEIIPLKWYDNNNHRLDGSLICTAPLWQQAIDWLREDHNINISISIMVDERYNGWRLEIRRKRKHVYENFCYQTFGYAREQAILKAFELILQTI